MQFARTVRFPFRQLGAAMALLGALSCSNSNFGGGAGSSKNADIQQSSGSSDSKDGGGRTASCPNSAKKVLILDFKSGWWSGYGGTFFKDIAPSLSSNCGGQLNIEYHHIFAALDFFQIGKPSTDSDEAAGDPVLGAFTAAGGATALGQPKLQMQTADFTQKLADYQAVWILSGEKPDTGDIDIADPEFVAFTTALTTYKGNFFIGTGAGMVVHGNAVSAALKLGQAFTSATPEPDNFTFTSDHFSIASVINVASNDALFTNVKTLDDRIDLQGLVATSGTATTLNLVAPTAPAPAPTPSQTAATAVASQLASGLAQVIAADQATKAKAEAPPPPIVSDALTTNSNITALLKGSDGKVQIARASAGLGRIVILDSGIQRFYGIKGSAKNDDTLRYLQNLLAYLVATPN